MTENILSSLKHIKTFVFDVDGVLTDGSVQLLPSGDQVRTMNTRDGYALQLAVKKGYTVAIITGGRSEAVRSRMKGLGITDVYLGATDKRDALEELLLIHDRKAENTLYMGDDLPDYEVMQKVGLPCCPSDAAREIKEIAAYISPIAGGAGCVRDIIERTLRLQGNWFEPENDSHHLAEPSEK